MKKEKKIEDSGTVSQIRGEEKNPNLLTQKVKNLTEAKINEATFNNIKKNIDRTSDEELQNQYKELICSSLKNTIASEFPDLYPQFNNLNYDELMQRIKNISNINKGDGLSFFVQDGDGKLTTTTFEISPNSYGRNMTNILNKVSVGSNRISLGDSFDAYEEFYAGYLESGEAMLRTMGYPITGVNQLDQNALVPDSTQTIAGYQCSLGVFINVPSAQQVGGGKGFGLFTMFASPENVMKLATTQPQQLASIIQIYRETALNTKTYTTGMVCTTNFLNNINNFVLDYNNQNIRNCLNGTLFPAIQISKTPTGEFNLGIPTFINQSSSPTGITGNITENTTKYGGEQINYNWLMTNQNKLASGIYKTGAKATTLQSPYLVQGSQELPRIQTSNTADINLIITPRFSVVFKSGTLSELFHYEYQNLTEYVKPENIHLLYKQVDIIAAPMKQALTTTAQGSTYAYNTPATLGSRGIPDNTVIVYYKGDDINSGSANYYDVGYNDMSNMGGAGQISTAYIHFAFGGGVLPYANGFICVMGNLLNTISDGSEPYFTSFDLDSVQTIYTPKNS